MRRIIGVAAMPELVSIALVCRNVDAKDLGSATGRWQATPLTTFCVGALALKISLGYDSNGHN